MDTQKIPNLLGNVDNKSSKFATRKWYVINDQNGTLSMIKTTQFMVKKMKIVELLNLKPGSLNQISVIIQTHIFL